MVRVDIEHAIKNLEGQIDELLKQNHIVPAYEIQWRDVAIALCRAELEREKNQLTCDGCLHDGNQDMPYVVCNYCPRKVILPDRYEPKGESK